VDLSEPLHHYSPVQAAFSMATHHFSSGDRLDLSAKQLSVARLFYLEEKPVSAIAAHLHMREDTVRTHLKRIRDKLEPVVGSRVSRTIAVWLREHPGALLQPEKGLPDRAPQKGTEDETAGG
jgi:DNA-binding CsgD family transcriptional regulator